MDTRHMFRHRRKFIDSLTVLRAKYSAHEDAVAAWLQLLQFAQVFGEEASLKLIGTSEAEMRRLRLLHLCAASEAFDRHLQATAHFKPKKYRRVQ